MVRLALSVLWPSFLVAIMAEGVFFSFFDPAALLLVGGHIDLPSVAAYTIGFFFFWTCCVLASLLSLYLMRGDAAPGQPPF